MMRAPAQVWLNGARANVYHLLSTDSGDVIRTVRLGGLAPGTAGMGQRCGGRFVAVYVAAGRREVVLQIGTQRFPLGDAATRVDVRQARGGVMTVLRVSHPDVGHRVVRALTLARFVLKRIDPTYDELDESTDDFLADVADIAADADRRAWIFEIKDPDWEPARIQDH